MFVPYIWDGLRCFIGSNQVICYLLVIQEIEMIKN
jgi:hypothetical protein